MFVFDSAPILYWMMGYLLAGAILLFSLFQSLPTRFFLLVSTLLVFYMRLPVIVFDQELNPDESQMLSHAITLIKDPVYWRSVDGTTIGPLDNYLLTIPHLFGFQIDYGSGRIMGLFCICAALLFLFFALKNWFGEMHARRLLLIPLIFLAFTQEKDFVHYSSEQLPFLLLSVQICLLSLVSTGTSKFGTVLFLLGLVAGAVPFAKLQGVPPAVVLTLSACWACLELFRRNRSVRPLFLLLAGCLTFPLMVFSVLMYQGLWTEFVDFYLLSNLLYTEGSPSRPMTDQFLSILNLSADFKLFTGIVLLAFFGSALNFFGQAGRKENNALFLPTVLVLLLLASVYSVTKSGKDFVHYLYFCIATWTLLAAYGTTRLYAWSLVFPCLLLAGFFINDLLGYRRELRFNNFGSAEAARLDVSPVIREVKKFTSGNDYMVVWGWNCGYYVRAQLAQGTAENHSERSIFESRLLKRYQERYLSDMKRTKPAVFLDATGKNSLWLQDRALYGHHVFPALAAYISLHYEDKGEFDGTRMYLKKSVSGD